MTERINGQGFRPLDTGATRRSESASKSESDQVTTSAPAGSSDTATVKLTRSALLLSRLAEVVRDAPVVDAERVRMIKDKLASGSYRIDDQSVADQMIRMDRELKA
jgi:negative regulator of flagellin synthesis FlgM